MAGWLADSVDNSNRPHVFYIQMDGTSPCSLVLPHTFVMNQKPTTKVGKNHILLWSKLTALVNIGPTYPSIHAFLFLSFCNQCSFWKANPFSFEAWNDCINPLAGSLQPIVFLTSLQYTIRLTLIGWRNPIFFFFGSCATYDLKQILYVQILGEIFFHHWSNLIGCLWHY